MKRKLKKEELGYIAGILDGEGGISLKRQATTGRRSFATLIQVTSTNQDMLYFLKKKLGGYIYKHSWKYSIEHNLKKSWVWHLRQYKEVQKLLKSVLHLLIIKRKQAKLVLRYIELHWYGECNTHDTTRYPKQLAKKELKVFLKLWEVNSRGAKARKPIIPEIKHFRVFLRKCIKCGRPINETEKRKNRYINKSLCYKCNIKKYGHEVYKREK